MGENDLVVKSYVSPDLHSWTGDMGDASAVWGGDSRMCLFLCLFVCLFVIGMPANLPSLFEHGYSSGDACVEYCDMLV